MHLSCRVISTATCSTLLASLKFIVSVLHAHTRLVCSFIHVAIREENTALFNMATPGPSTIQDVRTEEEEYGEDDEEYGDDYDDEGDYDAEAEEMARRLQDQLRADIARAQLEAAVAAAAALQNIPQAIPTGATQGASGTESRLTSRKRRHDAAILTMKSILSCVSTSSLVRDTLSTFTVPAARNTNVLDIFNQCISSGVVPKNIARPLSEEVVSLAKSDILFASLRNSDASAIQLDKGKRKRDFLDDSRKDDVTERSFKRLAVDQPDLCAQVSEAVRVITNACSQLSAAPTSHPPDPSVVSSIHPQLHQVFLFAVTSAPRAGQRTAALQELAGLIQMVGVLSGIPIGTSPSVPPHANAHAHAPPWGSVPGAPLPWAPADLGTAVYPCLVPTCAKVFHRLYSLRAHQRLHTLVERPYRCVQCPASFVRNHDLKRHARLHDKKAWRCSGCGKIFSRRDAIKRHKDARGRFSGKGGEVGVGESVCAYAEVEEVEVEKGEGDEEASRRAKMWSDIAANQMVSGPYGGPAGVPGAEDGQMEEGEIELGVVHEAQGIVLQLHGLLQAYVATGLGGPSGASQLHAPHESQVTLASVIARTQQFQPPTTADNWTGTNFAGNHTDSGNDVPHDAPVTAAAPSASSLSTTLSLSEEQTRLLEQAIAQAALAAQAQAEAEAALEEEGSGSEGDDDTY